MKPLNLLGQTFHDLTVESPAPNHLGKRAWGCKCKCGTTITVLSEKLRSGHTKSCGCRRLHGNPTHGHARGAQKTRTYKKWEGMIRRCHGAGDNYNHRWYRDRGVAVDSEWRKDYLKFLQDMGECPDGYELDRIDNTLGYAPGNCRWVTPKDNKRNMSNNKRVAINGVTKIVAEWCEILGLKPNVVYQRIYRGWPESEWFVTDNIRRKRQCAKKQY